MFLLDKTNRNPDIEPISTALANHPVAVQLVRYCWHLLGPVLVPRQVPSWSVVHLPQERFPLFFCLRGLFAQPVPAVLPLPRGSTFFHFSLKHHLGQQPPGLLVAEHREGHRKVIANPPKMLKPEVPWWCSGLRVWC